MQFVPKVNPTTSMFSLYLDLQGLDMSAMVDTETSNMTKNETRAVIDKFCYFTTTSYERLRSKSLSPEDGSLDQIFNEVHLLLKRCNKGELKEIAAFYLNAHYDILDKLATRNDIEVNLDGLMVKLSAKLAELDDKINLADKIREVVAKHVPVPAFDNVGNRPQDSKDMTFVRDEVVELTAVVVLCKFLTPIFAACIERMKKKIDTTVKEMHCARILYGVLTKRFLYITTKFQNFIHKLVEQRVKDELKYVFNGHTPPLVGHQIFSTLLTKRFVNVNLQQKECNLMTYSAKCTTRATDSSGSACSNHKTLVRPIKGPSEIHGDEGNISNLEVESRKSSKTVDQLGIITLAANMTITSWLADNELPTGMVDEILFHYNVNPIQITPINTYLVGVLFGKELGGAASVELLSMSTLMAMIALSQIRLIRLGYNDLAHLLTVSKSMHAKLVATPIDNIIKSAYTGSFEYRNMNSRYNWSVIDLEKSMDVRWDTHLKTIIEYITTVNHIQNTAPAICALMGSNDDNNGKAWSYKDTIVRDICGLLESVSKQTIPIN